MEGSFIAYRGARDIHDGTVEHAGDLARVVVKALNGRMFEVEFSGVESATRIRAEGMMLYSLSEMEEKRSPLRRFVFTNWEEEEEDDAELMVLARDFSCREFPRAQPIDSDPK
jgi:hypothetical protein